MKILVINTGSSSTEELKIERETKKAIEESELKLKIIYRRGRREKNIKSIINFFDNQVQQGRLYVSFI